MSKQKIMKEWRRQQRKRKVYPLHLICKVGKAYQTTEEVFITVKHTTESDYQYEYHRYLGKSIVFSVLDRITIQRPNSEEAPRTWIKILDERGKILMITGITSNAHFKKLT